MRKMDRIPDEADVLAENDTLKARVAELETKLKTAQAADAEQAPAPTVPNRGGKRNLTDECREAKANPRRKQTKYTGTTARCLAAKNQTTDNPTH